FCHRALASLPAPAVPAAEQSRRAPSPCKPRHDAATDPPSTRAPRAPTRNAGSRAAEGGQPVAVAPGPHPACCSKRRPLPHALVPGPPPPRRRYQDAPLLRAAQRRPPGDVGRPRAPLPGRHARHPRLARARLSRPPPHATLTRWHHGRRPGQTAWISSALTARSSSSSRYALPRPVTRCRTWSHAA
ncbi:hypothetical protein ZEAMMB73_Zm00001d014261, partial [Zea mays]